LLQFRFRPITGQPKNNSTGTSGMSMIFLK
jgi:hypothetical protein